MPENTIPQIPNIIVGDNSKEIDRISSDRSVFSDFIYATPIEEALAELARRQNDKSIDAYIEKSLPAGIPEPLKNGGAAVLFRQLATPNYELRRFVSIADIIDGLKPVFWEYYEDKFTSNNEWKKSLGKMSFYHGKGKKGGSKIDRMNVIDFNSYNGKKISEVRTTWGQTLVDFHHELFNKTYSKIDEAVFFDASDWFSKSGGTAKDYYKNFLTLFLKHGILFENFMIDQKEIGFTREVFLPAFMEIYEKTGLKPLIVALEPTDIEGDEFWMCHPSTSIDHVKGKLS